MTSVTKLSMRLKRQLQLASGGQTWASTLPGTYALATSAKFGKLATSSFRPLSRLQHLSLPKSTSTRCISRCLDPISISSKVAVRSLITQSSACYDQKLPRRSATGSTKISCVVGVLFAKSCPTMALHSSVPSTIYQNAIMSITFASVVTTPTPTDLWNDHTSMSGNRSSKPWMATRNDGHLESTQSFGQNASRFTIWVVLLILQLLAPTR